MGCTDVGVLVGVLEPDGEAVVVPAAGAVAGGALSAGGAVAGGALSAGGVVAGALGGGVAVLTVSGEAGAVVVPV